MAVLIAGASATDVWLDAVHFLHEETSGKTVNFNVAFEADGANADNVIDALDSVIADRCDGDDPYLVATVANTIFPQGLYQPHAGKHARQHLYEMNELTMPFTKKRKSNGEKDTYFNRLVAYPGPNGEPVNQLENTIERIVSQRATVATKSSAYEIGVSTSTDADLRVFAPGKDAGIMSFPCLSHLSFTLVDDLVHLSALYRNQHFMSRALGNYIGLARLVEFVANETGAGVGEVQCTASHADLYGDGDFRKADVESLFEALSESEGSL